MNKYENVDVLSPIYEAAHKRWKLVDALMDGKEAMKAALYIKQEIYEEEIRFNHRIDRTALTNFYKKTLMNHAGKVFSKDIELEGYDEEMMKWCEDVNLDGQNLTQFGKQVWIDGYNKGVSFILTDMERIAQPADGSKRTAADDMRDGLHPYLVHIPASNVIGVRTDRMGGKNVLTQFHYFENVVEFTDGSPFLPAEIKQVKVLEIGRWTIVRKDEKDKWVEFASGETDIDVIPITPFYTNKGINNFVGTPPLEDLADKTLQYYLAENDLDQFLHIANFPSWVFKGKPPQADENGVVPKLEYGPMTVTFTGSEQADFKPVGHDGNQTNASMKRLELMREEMELMGLAPLVNTARTATEANLNSYEAHQALLSCAMSLKDALENALLLFNKYIPVKKKMGNVLVNTDYRFPDDAANAKLAAAKKVGDSVVVNDVQTPTVKDQMLKDQTT